MGQFHSSHRAVTGDAKAFRGRLLAARNAVGGWCWMGIPLGQSEGWSLRGKGGNPPSLQAVPCRRRLAVAPDRLWVTSKVGHGLPYDTSTLLAVL